MASARLEFVATPRLSQHLRQILMAHNIAEPQVRPAHGRHGTGSWEIQAGQ